MTAMVQTQRRGRVAVLTLARGDKANTLNGALLSELAAALPRLAEQGVQAAVLTGVGETFSGGYDVAELPEQPSEEWIRTHGLLGTTASQLAEGPLPTVAALNGSAVGGGCDLA